MKYYAVAEIDITDRAGGRYLARTSRIASKDAAEAFYESDGYRPYRQSRMAGARSEFVLVAGEDINKAARIAG